MTAAFPVTCHLVLQFHFFSLSQLFLQFHFSKYYKIRLKAGGKKGLFIWFSFQMLIRKKLRHRQVTARATSL